MHEQRTEQSRYRVSIYEVEGAPGAYRFTFVSKGRRLARRPGEPPKPVPQYVASAREENGEVAVEWSDPLPRTSTRVELEQVARDRLAERIAWIERVANLVGSVEKWAKELGWSTKRIDKKLEDPWIGNHKVAALLMQYDTVRVLLEPVSPSAPGSQGLVDLYLMPGYDDIASFYFRESTWHVHYVFSTQRAGAAITESESRPLSKKTLGAILGEMKKHGE